MRSRFFVVVFFLALTAFGQDSLMVRKIFNQELSSGVCYERLRYLSKNIGGRLAGSPQEKMALEWAFKTLKEEGFDSVWLQEVMVPHWVRGAKEQANFKGKHGKTSVNICALGGSVATPKSGLKAKVIEVKSLKELELLGTDKIKGKIVFFNRPMDPLYIRTFEAYGAAVDQRGQGAAEAAKYGAVGVVVRSMASNTDPFPHTGAMRYKEGVEKIPACAISTLHAEALSKALAKDAELDFWFNQQCQSLPEEKSYNVIAEIKGSENPNEVILVGGHLDAWDNGEGAHDDGAGCVQSMEVLHLMKTLGIKPKRTIRCVLFANEENGLRGGSGYAAWAAKSGERHIAAIESDAGGFTPRNFNTTASGNKKLWLQYFAQQLKPYGIEEITEGGGGADIGPLKGMGVCLIGFGPDSQRYFDLHHSSEDTFEKVSKRELELGAGNIAALAWLISEYGLND